jgi:hypothetical protein
MHTHTYFYINVLGVIVSPYFDNVDIAEEWLDKEMEKRNQYENRSDE